MKKLTHIGLFAGCGGLDLGIEQAGFKTVAVSDNWKPAIETLKKNFKNSIIKKMDITEMTDPKGVVEVWISEYNKKNSDSVKEIDLISGGPPCQPFSKLNQNQIFKKGKLANFKDERIPLSEHFFKVVNNVRPKFFIFENVPDLKQMKNKDESLVIDVLRKLIKESGYKLIWDDLLNSADFGVPQRRKRYFLIGALESLKINKLKFESLESGRLVKDVLDEISDLRKNRNLENDEGFDDKHETEFKLPGTEEKINRIEYVEEGKFHNHLPVNTKAYEMIKMKESLSNEKKLKKDHYIVNVETGEVYSSFDNEEYVLNGRKKKILKFKEVEDFSNNEKFKAFRTKPRMGTYLRRLKSKDVSSTITRNRLWHPKKNRFLTLREVASIQSFPNDYCFESKNLNIQLGNAVPPELAKAIALKILENYEFK